MPFWGLGVGADSCLPKEPWIIWRCTFMPPGEYDWTIHVQWLCGLMSHFWILVMFSNIYLPSGCSVLLRFGVVEVRGPIRPCLWMIHQPMRTWQQCHHSAWWHQPSTLGRQPLSLLLTLSMSLATLLCHLFIIPRTLLLHPSVMPQRCSFVVTLCLCRSG